MFFTSLCAAATPVSAMSVRAFDALSGPAQGKFVADYVLNVKMGLAQTNPAFAQSVWDYFVKDVPGKTTSQGLEDMLVQELVIDKLAKQGKADPSKIEIESVINYVIKQHFTTNS